MLPNPAVQSPSAPASVLGSSIAYDQGTLVAVTGPTISPQTYTVVNAATNTKGAYILFANFLILLASTNKLVLQTHIAGLRVAIAGSSANGAGTALFGSAATGRLFVPAGIGIDAILTSTVPNAYDFQAMVLYLT